MHKALPIPMSTTEIRKAVSTLKNIKSPGMDQVNIELLKYLLEVVYEKITDIYNNIAARNHARNFKSTTKARKTERTNIKSSSNNSFIRS